MIQIIKIDRFVSIDHFARMNGVAKNAIERRIKRKTVSIIVIDGFRFVDANNSYIGKKIDIRIREALPNAVLPDNINPNNLRGIRRYAEKYGIRSHHIYEKILMGKLKAYLIKDIFFFDITEL